MLTINEETLAVIQGCSVTSNLNDPLCQEEQSVTNAGSIDHAGVFLVDLYWVFSSSSQQ